MDKLKMQTPDLVEKNIEQIAKIFPHVITETKNENGDVKKAIDFDLLKQSLINVLVEDDSERYRLDWPGKKASLLKANLPIIKTLRPVREESVDFDTTENLYIEGDNFEVLKILQESYLGKIKMIYIDPPYNTGNDFLFLDKYNQSQVEYDLEIGLLDEENQKLFKNTDSNGRFHSDWLSMMYERIILAKDILDNEGVIFISIDDNEIQNLRKICDEVFGEKSVEQYIWDVREDGTLPKTPKNTVRKEHEYLLAAYKNTEKKKLNKYYSYKYLDIENWGNPDNDPRGPWMSGNISRGTGKGTGGSNSYLITNPKGVKFDRDWSIPEQEFLSLLDDDRIYFADNGNGVPRRKIFQNEPVESIQSSIFENLKSSQTGKKQIQDLIGEIDFPYPKPVELIKRIIQIATKNNDIVLDFFSGSGSTAQAVLELNSESTDCRNFIMIQLPEKTEVGSKAYEAGYKTISEIGKERIRRAGQQIKQENLSQLEAELKKIEKDLVQESLIENEELTNKKIEIEEKIEQIKKLDIGFRVYKTDTSNMKDVFYHPSQLDQTQIDAFESNIKADRTSEDLLTQVILDLGLELSLPIEKKEMLGNEVFIVQSNALIACFDDNINFEIVDHIADIKPFKVVFKDASFKDDKDRINVEERFKRLSPETKVTVI